MSEPEKWTPEEVMALTRTSAALALERQRAARNLVLTAAATLAIGLLATVLRQYRAQLSSFALGALGAVAAIAAVATVILLLLAALRTQRRYRVWWTALGLLGAAAIAGLAWLFVYADSFVPAAEPLNTAAEAARITSVTTLRGGALAGALGLAAIGTLIVNAVGARTAARNLELAREAQADAREQAQRTAEGAARTLELTRTGQLTDRYVAAVELLTAGATGLMSDLGGIYALERLAADAPSEYRANVVEVLSAYVRTRAGLERLERAGASYLDWRGDEAELEVIEPPAPQHDAALLAALTVLGRLATPPPDEPDSLDDPVAADGTGRDLVKRIQGGALRADLRRCNLRNVTLDGADLRGALLRNSDLRDASLRKADLRFADLSDCDLSRAHLDGAKISGSQFLGSWLRHASLDAATAGPAATAPERAQFAGADLKACSFVGADLRGAQLAKADGLRGDELEDAFGDTHTTVPRSVARPGDWLVP